jgi:hypothetical protein
MNRYFLGISLIILGIIVSLIFASLGPLKKSENFFKTSREEAPSVVEKYPLHQEIMATVFWVGEEASEENDYISNRESIWDAHWLESFGGKDDPEERDGWYPEGFIPQENPFYLALPYSDFEDRKQKEDLTVIPWYQEPVEENVSLVKNRWVKVIYQDEVCYGQWEDAGPGLTDDVDYVFGMAEPQNDFGVGAGIDVSPALRDCLGMGSLAKIDWQFVDEENVPDGPWKEIITQSGLNF